MENNKASENHELEHNNIESINASKKVELAAEGATTEVSTKLRATGEYSAPCSTVSASPLQFSFSSSTNEWHTRSFHVSVVRQVLGGRIELDPASCARANETVRAERYYSIEDDGLAQRWNAATVFLNPPYGKLKGKSQAGIWAHRLIAEYTAGNVREAILLVNASTSERWFRPLFNFPICFSNRRIPFDGVDGKGCSPTKGSAIVYFGDNLSRFAKVCETNIGTVVIRYCKECAAGEAAELE
jgi:ParB family chromosome partitioning protein